MPRYPSEGRGITLKGYAGLFPRGIDVRRARGHSSRMNTLAPVGRFTVPLGGQGIELQQVDFGAGGMSLLRVRIREGRRFTVFDIDADTAARWGEAMQAWARAHPAAAEELA